MRWWRKAEQFYLYLSSSRCVWPWFVCLHLIFFLFVFRRCCCRCYFAQLALVFIFTGIRFGRFTFSNFLVAEKLSHTANGRSCCLLRLNFFLSFFHFYFLDEHKLNVYFLFSSVYQLRDQRPLRGEFRIFRVCVLVGSHSNCHCLIGCECRRGSLRIFEYGIYDYSLSCMAFNDHLGSRM